MKIINLIQGSEEWKDWRSYGIGASEISVLMNTNPFKTKLQLWEEKCGFRSTCTNDAMLHGNIHEDKARKLIEEKLGVTLKNLCVEHDDYPEIKASLDGYNDEHGILVEIKCPFSNSSLKDINCEKDIPLYYLDQIRYQMIIVRPKKAYFVIYDSNNMKLDLIEINTEETARSIAREALMIKEALEFWQTVRIGAQPEPTEKDYLVIDDEPELEQLLLKYKEINSKEKELNIEKKIIKEKIFNFGDDGNFMAYGAKIKRVADPGKYNIEKMRQDGIDVEKYFEKSKNIGSYRIFL